MSNKVSELITRKNSLISEATSILDEKGPNSPEYKRHVEQIDAIESDISMYRRVADFKPATASAPVVSASVAITTPEQRRAKLNETWRQHLQGRNTPETRDILTTSDGAGGAVVPDEFSSGFLSEALKFYAPLMDWANVRTSPNGRPVKIGRVSDVSHGLTILTEGSSTPVAEADPTFSSSVVSTDLFTSGLIRFSNNLLSDSSFDLQRLLTNLSSIRVGRGIEKLLVLGTDASGTTAPNNAGLVNIAQVATTTGTLSAGISWGDLEVVFDALDPAYLPKSCWLMSSKTRNFLAGLKDTTGRPLFVPGTQNSFDTLFGRPILITQSLGLPSVANAMPIILGDLYNGLQIITSEIRVQNLVERYAEVNESALIVSTRIGSAGLQVGALQALKLAAA